MIKLSHIKEEWSKHIILKDHRALDLVLATVVGNMLVDLDPIWTMITGPSSGGKTTLVAPLEKIKVCHFVDDMSEKTLLSGFKAGGKDQSLLKKIGNGIMVCSDFTSILAKNPIMRGELLSQLKLVYDRKVSKYTGTGGVFWNGKIGFIGCATPDIYYHLESGRSMGERFIFYWLDVPSDGEIAKKQSTTFLSAKAVTDIMSDMYLAYFEDIKTWATLHGVKQLNMTDIQRERVRSAAMFCVAGKTTVHVNFKSGKIDQIPQKASVGRDNKMFEALLTTLQLQNCYENDDPNLPVQDWMIELIEKCAYSSINRERRAILEILATSDRSLTASQIGASNGLGLEKEGVTIYLAPLFAVGLIKRDMSGQSFKWFMDDKDTINFIKKIACTVPQIKLKEIDPAELAAANEELQSESEVDAEFEALGNGTL